MQQVEDNLASEETERSEDQSGQIAQMRQELPGDMPAEIAEDILAFAEIIKELPEDIPPEYLGAILQSVINTSSVSYSGPVPPPAMVRAYEEMNPGSAKKFLEMAEKEQSSRHRDGFMVRLNDSFRIFGSIIVSLALIGAAVYCAVIGQPELGGILGTSGVVVGIIRHFIGSENK